MHPDLPGLDTSAPPVPPALQPNPRPLVVDLDGCLVKTDLLYETANAFLTRHPLQAARLGFWLLSGKAALKEKLARNCPPDYGCLPYRKELLDRLATERESGRRLILATASDAELGHGVADHLGLFDEVLASDGQTNLRGAAKAELLTHRYGAKGFDYAGNSRVDLPVWQAANASLIVGGDARLAAKAREVTEQVEIIGCGPSSPVLAIVMALRPHQWAKNLLVLIPLLLSHKYAHVGLWAQAVLGTVLFCLLASSVYVFNDLVDLPHDRKHPSKCERSFACGSLSPLTGWLVWPVLLLVACALAAAFLPPLFLVVMAVYFLLSLGYSLSLKRYAAIDVLVLAILYAMRIVAGAAAIKITPSFWLLAFSMFLFLSLALVKRFAELRQVELESSATSVNGRGYLTGDLGVVSSLGISSGYMAVLVLALYVNDGRTAQLYKTPQIIWLACPLLLLWITRTWLIAYRGGMNEDPTIFALKDRAGLVVLLSIVALFAAATLL